MDQIRHNNPERAQGMVEFALVLPILLLVILGIFAFGHMFFSYTTVVSASREAARYGAVVGVNAGGEMRYRDCAGIRDAAERIGTFAGVTAVETTDGYEGEDPGIYVGYDGGPGSAVYDTCPEGGLGPNDVDLGDRILVRVSIEYEPIVPLLDLPSFPLSATTARTIIKDVPVGQAPTAVPSTTCLGTTLTISGVPTPIIVGQVITPQLQVTVDDGSDPEGTVVIIAADAEPPVTCEGIAVSNDSTFSSGCAIVFDTPVASPGYPIQAVFTPTDSDAQCGSSSVFEAGVDAASTTIAIDQITPMPYAENHTVLVSFKLAAISPGVFKKTPGTVTVNASSGTSSFSCSVDTSTLSGPDGSGQYSGSCALGSSNSFNRGSTYMVQASYGGSVGYNVAVSGSVPYVIPLEPTEPPVEPTEPPVEPPSYCPVIGNFSFSIASALEFDVNNSIAGGQTRTLESVRLIWPELPDAKWQEIRFGPNLDSCTTSGQQQNRNCVWRNVVNGNLVGLSPTDRTVSSASPPQWVNAGQSRTLALNTTKRMRLVFSRTLGTGDYRVELVFSGGCKVSKQGAQ